jgi:ribosomal-protein-alanine N-acetyltransferase
MSETAVHDVLAAVKLRALTPADLRAVHVLLSDWNVVRYMLLPNCTTEDETRKCLDDLMTESPGGAWQSVVRAIELQNASGVVGLSGVVVLHGSKQGEIWYLVKPDHWGRGIAQQAARELLRIGFSEMNLHRMFATCHPENPASAWVIEKIGMRKEGFQLKNLKIHGAWHDSFLYAILREEWVQAVSASAGPSGGSDAAMNDVR